MRVADDPLALHATKRAWQTTGCGVQRGDLENGELLANGEEIWEGGSTIYVPDGRFRRAAK